MGRTRDDLVGRTFGELIVIKQIEDKIWSSGNCSPQWLCRCSCGNQVKVCGKYLKNGHKKSCGCIKTKSPYNFEDLTERRFGKLLVMYREETKAQPSKQHKTMWRCKCDCGNEVIVSATHLKSGHTQSCGCIAKDKFLEMVKKYNDYEIQEDYVIMYTQSGNPFYVDLDDFWKVKNICWYMDNGYLLGLVNGKKIQLHRFIMNCPKDRYVDHIGGSDTRNDNRKQNLRIVTMSQNCMNSKRRSTNTSGVTGVCWDKYHRRWHARLEIYGKMVLSKFYDNFEDAVKARKEAEEKYHKSYSYDNSQKIRRQNNE